jgi:hypothetical protein
VERILAIFPKSADEDVELVEEISSGFIHLHLWPGASPKRRLLFEPSVTCFNDSEQRIRSAISNKKRQVQKSNAPVLLAVHASGINSSLEDFDKALYGRSYAQYNERRVLVETGFDPTGIFSKTRKEAPTYAGVLAFLNVGFREHPGPVLYRHPRFDGVLPEAVLELEQRFFDMNASEVRSLAPSAQDLMNRLKFVDPQV